MTLFFLAVCGVMGTSAWAAAAVAVIAGLLASSSREGLSDAVLPLSVLLLALGVLWRANAGGEQGTGTVRAGHRGTVRALSVAPDGTMVASASGDHTVRLWALASCECVAVCGSSPANVSQGEQGTGHGGVVTGVCFAPTSDRLLSVSVDKTLRVWDTRGVPIAIIYGHSQMVQCCGWAPNGRQLASAGSDRALRFWQLVRPGQEDDSSPAGPETDWTNVLPPAPLPPAEGEVGQAEGEDGRAPVLEFAFAASHRFSSHAPPAPYMCVCITCMQARAD